MRYFVSYVQLFHNDDAIKKETFRLQTYNILIHFLTRKDIPGNVLCYEFKQMKHYFESKEFTNVYFLSPFVFNENAFAKDVMKVITSSGETNHYNGIMNQVKDEIESIKVGRDFVSIHRIKAENADEYISLYLANPSSLNRIDLDSPKEREIVITNANDGYKKGNLELSLLRFRLLIKYASGQTQIKEAIKEAKGLYESHKDNTDLISVIASAYNNQFYQDKDKYTKLLYWLNLGSDLNDANTTYLLGLIYFIGEGVSKDTALALKYWEKAALAGNMDAASGIGVYYLSKGDKKSAKPYLIKTAALGDYKALLLLDTDFDRK